MAYTTIKKPSDYFNTKLYTGTGASQSITGVGFQPDLNWTKDRNATENHSLTDAVRGATKRLFSNTTGAESINVASLTSFDSDGFTVGGAGTHGTNGNNYVSWNWLANGTGVSNTDGSITSTVSANTTSGFSIISRTGTGSVGTVGHGLGSVPKMIITKKISASDNWGVYHSSLGATKYLVLNDTSSVGTSTSPFNNTEPTSSVFTVGTGTTWNGSGETFIDYCFAEKKGFSKAFSYTGNGSSDGSFCYLGFRPAFIMIKGTSIYSDWGIWDNKRPEYNVVNLTLQPHKDNAEVVSVGRDIDILSNGFKGRGTSSSMNSSGATYVGIAFAESPFVASTGIPTTAR